MFRYISKVSAVRLAVCILLTLAPFGAAVWLCPRIEGDGTEYLLMQESLKNHFSPDFREIDRITYRELIRYKALYSTSSQGWYDVTFLENLDAGKHEAGGYIRCKDEHYRSYHFWAYSLSSLPFRILCGWLELDPAYSFGMLHALLLSCAIGMILCSRRFGFIERCGLAFGLLFICTVFYFDWIHPELFSTTFLAMAIIRYLDRKTASALIFAAIASLQNQPIALALPLFYLTHTCYNPEARKGALQVIFPFTRWDQWMLAAIAALIVLLPSFYYLSVYGHSNPIAHLGGLSTHWITLSRLGSLWFDINQGIVVGFPGLVAGVLLLLPVSFLFGKREYHGYRADAIILLFLSLLLSIPCLTQGNWNAGCAMMVRYGLWIGIPLLFILPLLLRTIANPAKRIFVAPIVLLQLWVPTYCGYPAKTVYLKHNPLSMWVMNRFPSFYNPDPEIFSERLCRKEEVMITQNRFVWRSNGRVKKILSRNSPLDASNFWDEKNFYRELAISSVVASRDGWSYLNGDFTIIPSGEYTIRYDDPAAEWKHWSVVEPGFRWSLGYESSIRFPIHIEKGKAVSGLVRIRLQSHRDGKFVEIYLNGRKLYGQVVLGFEELTLKYQPDWIHAEETNELLFRVPDATPPPNGDDRILGVRFTDMTFQTIPNE